MIFVVRVSRQEVTSRLTGDLDVSKIPGRDADAPGVMRRDPVRALAEARVGPGFNATQVLDPAPPPKATATESAADPDRLEPASPGVPTAPVETLRVDVRASEP